MPQSLPMATTVTCSIVNQSTHSGTFITAMWQRITWREVIAVLLITAIGVNYILDSERQL